MRRIVVALGGVMVLVMTFAGCSTTLGDLPLPGTGVEGETIVVEADFDEALNLATGAVVKVDGVDSGRVQDVSVVDFRARVRMLVQTGAELREGATARLRYTTPLGELFVDVTNAERGAPLADGARLPQRDTSTAPTVEDALAQASLLVNGGGLAQLQTVTEELRGALEGREDRAVSVLDRTLDVLDQVDAATGDVDRALRSLDSVSRTLRQRRETINGVLRDVRPAARVLRRATPRLVELLSEVESFAEVADDTVRRTREDLLSALRQAGPVLETLAGTRGEYADSLRALVRLAEELDGVAPGDYLNLSFDLRLTALSGGLPGLPILGDLLDDLLGGLVTALLGEEGLVDGLLDDLLGGLLGRAGGAR